MTAVPASYGMSAGSYPVSLTVDPPGARNRLSILLRILFLIPAIIVAEIIALVAGVCVVISWFAILITGGMPAGLANFIAGALRWILRVQAYALLQTDAYPPFSLEELHDHPVRPSITPQLEGRNRLTVFFRYFMLIPHMIVLYFLQIAASVVVVISWLVGVFTGAIPEGLSTFITGYLRWAFRVGGYGALITDEYPPFSLN